MGFLGTETDRMVTMAGGLGRGKGCAELERFPSVWDNCSEDIFFWVSKLISDRSFERVFGPFHVMYISDSNS
jgi:hypothetical protein